MKLKVYSDVNPYIEFRESSIHNMGGFAKSNIPKGTKIIQYVGPKLTKAESDALEEREKAEARKKGEVAKIYTYELDETHDIDGNVDYNYARWINHSCDPNCDTDVLNGEIWIYAARDIKPGEEITYDYGFDLEDYKDYPCLCGSQNCVGYIVDSDEWVNLKNMIEQDKHKKK